jgi:hypothetical protein
MSRKKQPIYAVVRVDKFLPASAAWTNRVTVKEVVTTQKLAEEEVARLSKLQGGSDCEYFWQTTRLVTKIK